MNTVKEFGTIVCLLTISCAVMELISPSGSMQKIMKFSISVFMISTLAISIVKLPSKNIFDFTVNHSENPVSTDFPAKVKEQTNKKIEENLSPLVSECLKSMNIVAQKINVFMDTQDKAGISIIKVQIYLDEENFKRQDDIKKGILEKTGLDADILRY